MTAFAWVCLGCAAVPALLYVWNSFLFREPPILASGGREPPDDVNTRGAHAPRSPDVNNQGSHAPRSPGISVLIPARNERHNIRDCLEYVLASSFVEVEVIVMDDGSTDGTADVVRSLAGDDPRIRLAVAPPLPPGWCGKQHACHELAKLARHDILVFLDADVRLNLNALARMSLFLEESRADLVSTFPSQATVGYLEKLLIPLIHWVLLCWLPLWAMRRFRWSAFGAGCGQFFMTTRAAYDKVGGHAAVKASLHDGLTLPRAYRRAGLWTDICDGTNIARCRMYASAGALWNGLAKNAREGMASAGQIGFWTVVLICGQVLGVLVGSICLAAEPRSTPGYLFAATAVFVYLPRIHAQRRFGQNTDGKRVFSSVALHPIGVLLLLAVQWYAILRAVVGRPVGWKGRAHPGA